jgi:hypothetical protein
VRDVDRPAKSSSVSHARNSRIAMSVISSTIPRALVMPVPVGEHDRDVGADVRQELVEIVRSDVDQAEHPAGRTT